MKKLLIIFICFCVFALNSCDTQKDDNSTPISTQDASNSNINPVEKETPIDNMTYDTGCTLTYSKFDELKSYYDNVFKNKNTEEFLLFNIDDCFNYQCYYSLKDLFSSSKAAEANYDVDFNIPNFYVVLKDESFDWSITITLNDISNFELESDLLVCEYSTQFIKSFKSNIYCGNNVVGDLMFNQRTNEISQDKSAEILQICNTLLETMEQALAEYKVV